MNSSLSPLPLFAALVRFMLAATRSRKSLFVPFWQNMNIWAFFLLTQMTSLFLYAQFLPPSLQQFAAVEVFTEFLVFWWLRICAAQFSVWLVLVHSKMSRFPKLDSSSPRLRLVTAHCAMGILSFTLPSWVWHNTVAPVGTTNTTLIHPVIQTAQMHSIFLNILQILSVCVCEYSFG